jgi:hypothetical protein
VYAVNGFSNSYATVIVIITKRLKILSTLICLSKSQQGCLPRYLVSIPLSLAPGNWTLFIVGEYFV